MRPTTKRILLVLLLIVLFLVLFWALTTDDPTTEDNSFEATAAVEPIGYIDKLTELTSTTTIPPTTTTTIPPTTTTKPPEPTPVVETQDSGVDWYAIAMCESSLGTGAPQWHINTGNGYYGGLQFSHSTWIAYGGGRYADNAHLASPDQQIAIASGMSLSHWPTCGKYG